MDGLKWDSEEDGVSALPLRVVRPVQWSLNDAGDRVTIRMDRAGRETFYTSRIVPILEGLEAGDGLPGIVDRLLDAGAYTTRAQASRTARRIVGGLVEQGNVEIVLPATPEVFVGRYERLRLIGRGGMGLAWLCRDRLEGEDVVVKHAWNWSGPLAPRDESIRREAAMMALLDHPRIVASRATFELDGRFHLVRDYGVGEVLTQKVLREGPPGPGTRRRIVRAVAEILSHIHERDALCLDPKPANFLSGRAWEQVTLVDLGHVQRTTEGELDLGRRWGTAGFIAPEVLDGRPATARSDVYGLACLHVFLIAMHPPRSARLDGGALKELEEKGATTAELGLLEACLAEDPAARPATPGEASELLG